MSIAKKILSNTAVQVLGRGINAVASIFILRMITGFLSVETYGYYTSIYDFLAFFGIAADLGLFTIAVREMGKGTRDRNFIASNILGMRMALTLCSMAAAVAVAFMIPAHEGTPMSVGIAIASMAVFLGIMHGTVSTVLQVELKMERATVGLVLGKLVTVGWMAAVIYWWQAGEPSMEAFYQLMVAGVVGNLIAFLYTFWYAAKHAKFRPQYNKQYWREILTTSAPYGLALILNMIYFRIDGLMILYMKGPGEAAFYGPAVRVLDILSIVPVYFMNSVLPVLSRAVSESKAKVREILKLSFSFLWLVALPVVVGLSLVAYPVIALISDNPELLSNVSAGIYGADWALQILAFAMGFAFLSAMFTYSLVAVNHQGLLLWINGSAAIVNIVANYFVIPEWGARGAAATSVVTEAFILLVAFLVARRYVRFEFDWKLMLKATFGVALMGGAVWTFRDASYDWLGLKNLGVVLLAGIGAAIYAAVLVILKAVPRDAIKMLRKA